MADDAEGLVAGRDYFHDGPDSIGMRARPTPDVVGRHLGARGCRRTAPALLCPAEGPSRPLPKGGTENDVPTSRGLLGRDEDRKRTPDRKRVGKGKRV